MNQFEQVSRRLFLCPSVSASVCFLPVTPRDRHVSLFLLLLQLFLPSLLRFTAGLLGRGDPLSRNCGLDVLVSLILAKAPPPTDGSMAFETYPLLFAGRAAG